jgi:hypothetical protein
VNQTLIVFRDTWEYCVASEYYVALYGVTFVTVLFCDLETSKVWRELTRSMEVRVETFVCKQETETNKGSVDLIS